MEEVKFFAVSVKLQEETDQTDRAGNPKIRKWKEDYIVRADNSAEANKIVSEQYDGSMAEWRIAQVKETTYVDVLNYSN
jgi:hypothetical protein